jgi:hypothetical protein
VVAFMFGILVGITIYGVGRAAYDARYVGD